MYDSVYNFSNIKRAFYDARHKKLNNPSANRFEINMLSECVRLSDDLKNKNYKVGKTTKFKVYYPKERDIESSSFQDKVIQHSYCDNVLYPTMLAESGAPMKYTQERLGHKDITVTMQIYQHASPTIRQEGLGVVEKMFSLDRDCENE